MAPTVGHYFEKGLGASTCKIYNAAMKKLVAFCSLFQTYTSFLVTNTLIICSTHCRSRPGATDYSELLVSYW